MPDNPGLRLIWPIVRRVGFVLQFRRFGQLASTGVNSGQLASINSKAIWHRSECVRQAHPRGKSISRRSRLLSLGNAKTYGIRGSRNRVLSVLKAPLKRPRSDSFRPKTTHNRPDPAKEPCTPADDINLSKNTDPARARSRGKNVALYLTRRAARWCAKSLQKPRWHYRKGRKIVRICFWGAARPCAPARSARFRRRS